MMMIMKGPFHCVTVDIGCAIGQWTGQVPVVRKLVEWWHMERSTSSSGVITPRRCPALYVAWYWIFLSIHYIFFHRRIPSTRQ